MRTANASHRATAGFSLIELLVSMVIALVVTLAISSVMIRSESGKRTTTSVNDVNQTGAYSAYVLDRAIRSAGSGYSQRWRDAFGCAINGSRANSAILPLPSAASAPFASVPLTVRLAPVLIRKDLANISGQVRGDVLTVIAGTSGFSEAPQDVKTSSVTTTSLRLPNVVGYDPGNLVLLADSSVTAGCMLQQVSAAATDTLTLSGTYYKATGTNVNLTAFGSSTVAVQLGNATDNLPQMRFYGVGSNNTLYSYDLLQPSGSDPELIADGVVEMRALYGVDTTTPPDGILDTWIDPISGSGYAAADLTDGSAAAQVKLRNIVAIKLGLILRTSLKEKTAIPAGTTLTLFGDLGSTLAQTRSISGSDIYYRFRTFETTIPLRNVLFAPP